MALSRRLRNTWLSLPGWQATGGSSSKLGLHADGLLRRARGGATSSVDRRAALRSTSLNSASSSRAKSRRFWHDGADPPQPVGRALEHPAEVLAEVRQVDLLLQPGRLGGEPGSARARRSRPARYVSSTRRAPCTSRRSTARLLTTKAIGLLISWATPAARRPRLASFSVWISAAWVSRRSLLQADDPLAGAEPDPQLVPVERLGQEVVGAGLHPLDQVLLLRTSPSAGWRRRSRVAAASGCAGSAPARPARASSSR